MIGAHRLVIATRNPGKLREFRRLLTDLGAPVVSLDDAGVSLTVDETGHTYEQNASLKAIGYARACGEITLADDSGVEVDALGGAPGVMSAVFTGPGHSDAQRTQRLLELLRGVPPGRRNARYRAVLAVAVPGSRSAPGTHPHTDGPGVEFFRGTCEGTIAEAPRGANGFGYDPVFLVAGEDRTMAELSDQEKDRISHRGNAARAAIPFLRRVLTCSGA